MAEYWKKVPGYSLFSVSSFGRIRRDSTGNIYKLQVWDGRVYVTLYKKGKNKLCRLHILMLLAFKGPPPKGMLGCHNDGNPRHNLLKNLRWDTCKGNARDRTLHGTEQIGEKHHGAKLTEYDIFRIRKLYSKRKRNGSVLAKCYNVTPENIYTIIKRGSWKHV